MITVRLPVLVDLKLLRFAFEVGRKTGAEIKIGSFYRITNGSNSVDCDDENEVRAYAAAVFGEPVSEKPALKVDAQPVAAPEENVAVATVAETQTPMWTCRRCGVVVVDTAKRLGDFCSRECVDDPRPLLR